jgi:ParB family chromosome partitioning protein
MDLVQLPLERIAAPDWNANQMDPATKQRLRNSVVRFGLVVPLVVRLLMNGMFETVGGAHRLGVLRELGYQTAPCVVVEADDIEARLLSQCLNRIAGDDDLGLKAELVKQVLAQLSQQEVLKLLPETAESLQAMAALEQEDLAQYLRNWQQAQSARLKHLTFQSQPGEVEVIERALARFLPRARQGAGNKNPTCGAWPCTCCARNIWSPEEATMDSSSQQLPCLVCGCQLIIRVARGRKSGKPFVMIICPADGRHFRGFVGDREYVSRVAQAAGIWGTDPAGPSPGGGGRGGVGAPEN